MTDEDRDGGVGEWDREEEEIETAANLESFGRFEAETGRDRNAESDTTFVEDWNSWRMARLSGKRQAAEAKTAS